MVGGGPYTCPALHRPCWVLRKEAFTLPCTLPCPARRVPRPVAKGWRHFAYSIQQFTCTFAVIRPEVLILRRVGRTRLHGKKRFDRLETLIIQVHAEVGPLLHHRPQVRAWLALRRRLCPFKLTYASPYWHLRHILIIDASGSVKRTKLGDS